MSTDTLQTEYDIFERVPLLLRNFSQDDMRHFLSIGHTTHFKPDAKIIDEAVRMDNTAFLIIAGRVVISRNDVELTVLRESDFIGENSLLNQANRTATITALTPVVALRFDKDTVLDFFRKKPERLFKVFILNVLEIQSRRIEELNQKLSDCRKTYRSEL